MLSIGGVAGTYTKLGIRNGEVREEGNHFRLLKGLSKLGIEIYEDLICYPIED